MIQMYHRFEEHRTRQWPLGPAQLLIITGNPHPRKMQAGEHFVPSLKEFTEVLTPISGPFRQVSGPQG